MSAYKTINLDDASWNILHKQSEVSGIPKVRLLKKIIEAAFPDLPGGGKSTGLESKKKTKTKKIN